MVSMTKTMIKTLTQSMTNNDYDCDLTMSMTLTRTKSMISFKVVLHPYSVFYNNKKIIKLAFRTAVIPAVSFQGVAPEVILTQPLTSILAGLVVPVNGY